MEEDNLNEMKEMILKYVINEYIDDDDTTITYETPLISSGYVDSFFNGLAPRFSWRINSRSKSRQARQRLRHLTALITL